MVTKLLHCDHFINYLSDLMFSEPRFWFLATKVEASKISLILRAFSRGNLHCILKIECIFFFQRDVRQEF